MMSEDSLTFATLNAQGETEFGFIAASQIDYHLHENTTVESLIKNNKIFNNIFNLAKKRNLITLETVSTIKFEMRKEAVLVERIEDSTRNGFYLIAD